MTTAVKSDKKSTKVVDVKNGDSRNTNVLTQEEIDAKIQAQEAELKALKQQKREMRQVGAHSLAKKFTCENPSIKLEDLKAKLQQNGIDVEKHKTTISTTYHDVRNTVKLLGEFGHLSS